jgi:hypothetical protein
MVAKKEANLKVSPHKNYLIKNYLTRLILRVETSFPLTTLTK